VLTGPEQVASEVHRPHRWFGSQYRAAIGLSLLLAVLGGGYFWYLRPDYGSTAPRVITQGSTSRTSIAVLPFDNLSGDPEQDYFVDGMTDDLITDLSKLSSLFVIARNSVFAYKGLNLEPDKVAHDLGVRYILDGSVRAVSGRVRINARLIDTETGGQIWAERFDRDIHDVFALQDDVTGQIVSAMATELTSDEQKRLNVEEKETTPAVYDLYLRGVDSLRQFTPLSVVRARGYFLNALALDPDYGRAYAALAFTYTVNAVFFNEPNVDEALSEALRYGERALDIDPTLPQGHFAMAIALLRQGHHSEALEAARNAIKYDPNYADGYAALANVLAFSGKGPEAVDAMSKAMELNPRYSAAYLDILGRALFVVGNYLEAARYLEECVSRDPAALGCHVFLSVVYALNDQSAEAEWQVEEVRSLAPEFSITNNNISYQFEHEEQRNLFEKGLRLAGIRNGGNQTSIGK
jgi:adenylate cyclase